MKKLGGGGQTSAIAAVGNQQHPGGNPTTNTELYDGASWTEVNNANRTRSSVGAAAADSTAIIFGGYAPLQVQQKDIPNCGMEQIGQK